MTYTPIKVKVPGIMEDILDLSATQAKLLIKRLERELQYYNTYKAQYGIKKARKLMGKRHYRLW